MLRVSMNAEGAHCMRRACGLMAISRPLNPWVRLTAANCGLLLAITTDNSTLGASSDLVLL